MGEARIILNSPCLAITHPLPPLAAPLPDGSASVAQAVSAPRTRHHDRRRQQSSAFPSRTIQDLAARGEIAGAAKLGRRWTFDLEKLRRF